MPTRDEIAGWLREAQKINEELCDAIYAAEPDREEAVHTWRKRMSQVESMRCGTCRYWVKSSGEDWGQCGSKEVWKKMESIIFPGKDFCCFEWEGEE